jgi:hypothetical protein
MACPSHAHQNLCRKNVTACMFNIILEIDCTRGLQDLGLVCAECQCAPEECARHIRNIAQCKYCTKQIYCCIDFHHKNIAVGIKKLPYQYKQDNLKLF